MPKAYFRSILYIQAVYGNIHGKLDFSNIVKSTVPDLRGYAVP